MARIFRDLRRTGLPAVRGLAACALALALGVSHAADSAPPDPFEAGRAHFQNGHFESAISDWETAAARFRAAGEERARAEVLLRLAQAYQVLGHLERARNSLGEALADDRLDAASAVTGWTVLGGVLNASGSREQARKALDTAQSIARKLGRDDLTAAASHEMGNLLAALDQPREALQAYVDAAAFAKGPEGRTQRARSLLNAARTAIATGDARSAVDHALAAQQNISELSPSYERAFLFSSLGELHMRIHERARDPESLERSFDALQAGLADAERIGDERTSAQALGYLARLYEHEGRIEEAALLNRRAIFSAQQIQAAELLYQLHWQQGRIMRAKGEDEIAVLEYRRAADNLQLVRHAARAPRSDRRQRRRGNSIARGDRTALFRACRSAPAADAQNRRPESNSAPARRGARRGRALQERRAAGPFPGHLRCRATGARRPGGQRRRGHGGDLPHHPAGSPGAAARLSRWPEAIHRPDRRGEIDR
ncbi:MAG: tetratricopeptide repeat protein [Betaproteobacteria bacterium]|nr:tetratricopeptide repeat protein [Betaproteobacteria bacterium]